MTRENNIIETRRLNKDSIYKTIDKFFSSSGISVFSEKHINNKRFVKIGVDEMVLDVLIYAKNICNCGWKDRTGIKRIQVNKIEDSSRTTKNYCYLLLGLCFVNDEPIIVAWNPLKYIYHEKYRSAYVYDDVIVKAYKNGFYKTSNNGETILACRENQFMRLIKEYYDYSYIEDIK